MTVAQPNKLFQPVTVGDINLKHRVVLAPLTRMRAAEKTGIPSDLALTYYTQRASDGGLLISEGTLVAEEARSYDFVPGIWSPEQVQAWKKITAAVHAKGAHFYCQLFSNGRAAPAQPGTKVLGASAIPLPGSSQDVTPMAEEDIDRYVEHYKQAAVNAIEAGFDGVEIHYANGYHLDQFLQSVSNQRTDAYGGSLANRFRFPLRVLSAVSSAIGASRVGIRISPFSRFQDMREADPLATFVPFTEAVLAAEPELAYVHAIDGRISGAEDISDDLVKKEDNLDEIREVVKRSGKNTVLIVAGGISPERAEDHVQKYDELIAFGRYFTSNPDLPQRIKNGWPLKAYDRPTFYTQTAVGYTDFPEYTPVEAQQVKVAA